MSDAPYFLFYRNLKKVNSEIKQLIANLFFNHQKLTHV